MIEANDGPPDAIVTNWVIDILEGGGGAVFSFEALPYSEDGTVLPTKILAPLGFDLHTLKRLRATLDGLIADMEREQGGVSSH